MYYTVNVNYLTLKYIKKKNKINTNGNKKIKNTY